MKFIFDFDDTLFLNTEKFKKKMFSVLETKGVPYSFALEKYKEKRAKEFSLKEFIAKCFEQKTIPATEILSTYEDIMSECKEYVDQNLLAIVHQAGKENCFIVTNGDKEFQEDKIKRSGVAPLFQSIHIVPESKKEIIEKICSTGNENEEILFIENREHFFADLNTKKYPNLHLILYDKDGLAKVQKFLEK
ncbi:MAG: HAD hydrolase-like protein [Candidatus Pacebacteria bacterium]|nr:HAD hydrolase-like protein [Candidatus Paceibacterota bacterium]MCF7862598.1 HAD hydrolase-like protein [Candidatus Paceibacterota bacterium]